MPEDFRAGGEAVEQEQTPASAKAKEAFFYPEGGEAGELQLEQVGAERSAVWRARKKRHRGKLANEPGGRRGSDNGKQGTSSEEEDRLLKKAATAARESKVRVNKRFNGEPSTEEGTGGLRQWWRPGWLFFPEVGYGRPWLFSQK